MTQIKTEKAIEFSIKAKKTRKLFSDQITSSEMIYDWVRKLYSDDVLVHESFFVVCLNRANKITAYSKVSFGGTAGTVVDTKIVAKIAIDSLAASVILVHNHPSGNTKPSDADYQITRKIKTGLDFFDVTVLDHLIITDESYHSFADNGRI